MPGRRLKSYRSGDLSEELGVFLLKSFAAVATVPRPEDVGIDAIATLLRDDGRGLLFAEDSFYVQLKSSSQRRLEFKEHEVEWLKGLKLPLFIGSVERGTASIALYSTNRLSQVLLEMDYREIHLTLDPVSESNAPAGTRHVHLGPPILSWAISDLNNEGFATSVHKVLKPFIQTEQRNLHYRPSGYVELLQWKTNEIPPDGRSTMIAGRPDDRTALLVLLGNLWPHIQTMLMHFGSRRDTAAYDLLLALVELMRREGFNADPGQVYSAIRQVIVEKLPPG